MATVVSFIHSCFGHRRLPMILHTVCAQSRAACLKQQAPMRTLGYHGMAMHVEHMWSHQPAVSIHVHQMSFTPEHAAARRHESCKVGLCSADCQRRLRNEYSMRASQLAESRTYLLQAALISPASVFLIELDIFP